MSVAADESGTMEGVVSRSATELLLLPVQLRGIRLGGPVDLLLDRDAWRALGFVVLCGDESRRFLPYAAADLGDDEIGVTSALLLLEHVEFYEGRSRSLRALLGREVVSGRRDLGDLYDLFLSADGGVEALVVERDGLLAKMEPGGARVELVPAA
jgi:hypothetical protein